MGRPQVSVPAAQIRPVAPPDAQAFVAFVDALSPASRTHRFLSAVRELAPGLVRLLTQPPGETQLGLVAVADDAIVGEARYALDKDGEAEFAIAVADGWQRRGLGRRLLQQLLAHARRAGLKRIVGEVAASNAAMLEFARRLGFAVRMHPGDARLARIDLDLGTL